MTEPTSDLYKEERMPIREFVQFILMKELGYIGGDITSVTHEESQNWINDGMAGSFEDEWNKLTKEKDNLGSLKTKDIAKLVSLLKKRMESRQSSMESDELIQKEDLQIPVLLILKGIDIFDTEWLTSSDQNMEEYRKLAKLFGEYFDKNKQTILSKEHASDFKTLFDFMEQFKVVSEGHGGSMKIDYKRAEMLKKLSEIRDLKVIKDAVTHLQATLESS